MEEDDKALVMLEQMSKEFVTHKRRLAERAKTVAEAIATGQIADVPALGAIVVELYQELHDTGLSFQQELTDLIRTEWAKVDDEDEFEDDEEEEGGVSDDADAEIPEEDPSQLLPGDAAQLRRTTTEYRAILSAMLPNYQDADRKSLEAKLRDADASLELIDAIELRDAEGSAETDTEPPGADLPS